MNKIINAMLSIWACMLLYISCTRCFKNLSQQVLQTLNWIKQLVNDEPQILGYDLAQIK